MRQQSLATGNFEKYRKKTRNELFLDEMNQIILWQVLTAVIKPLYPEPKGAGRRPKGAERMLRIHFLQHWFELSNPAAEEVLYDSRAIRRTQAISSCFVGMHRMSGILPRRKVAAITHSPLMSGPGTGSNPRFAPRSSMSFML